MIRNFSALALALLLSACGSGRDRDPDPGYDPAGEDADDGVTLGGDDTAPGDSRPNDGTGTDFDPGVTGVELNTGWVGGACHSAADCDSTAFSQTAACVVSGFPSGMCTQACSQGSSGRWTCPDENFADPASSFTTTRCVADNANLPRCVAECDFDKSPSGCRPGYGCVLEQRFGSNDDAQIYPVCMPLDTQRWPGAAALTFDIGNACTNGVGCESLACLKFPNGYCTKYLCDLTGCPGGSTCFKIGNDQNAYTACLKDCSQPGQCRGSEGYACVDQYDACVPNVQAPPHDPSVGTADCAAAWGTGGSGLHPCDTTHDQYLVINKTARNMALCNAGAVVANFNVGLGFSPTGDKVQEGDGKTPEGVFYVPRRLPTSEYYKAFLLSYPDKADADRALTAGIISDAQKTAIYSAQDSCGEPPQDTNLGGFIEVHGEHADGGGDWTWGCVAIESANVDQVWATLDVHDTIIVKP